MKLYVASSWRNLRQPKIVAALREAGHEVYDFRHPKAGDDGFHWSEVDGGWRQWTPARFRTALQHPIAQAGFTSDFSAMKWADAGVLLLPCGRSAHLEAGYFVGAGKPLLILAEELPEPELMYLMAEGICIDVEELLIRLAFLGEVLALDVRESA